tara:strand:+ start:2740 stop:3402 length:663 start_codon:yes stop_codon:yes gene_type:complete
MQESHNDLVLTFEKALVDFDGPNVIRKNYEDILSRLKKIEFETKKKLFIFDLNGILIEKEYVPDFSIKREGWARVGKSLCRPYDITIELFKILFSDDGKNFCHVGIWTSAYTSNLIKMVKGCFPQYEKEFLFLWGQEQCKSEPNPRFIKDDKECKEKPILFWKEIYKVWGEFPQYNETNTVIIDDSEQKLENNPPECCKCLTNDQIEDFKEDLKLIIKYS